MTNLLRLDYFDGATGKYIGSHNPISNSMSEAELIDETILKQLDNMLINLPQGMKNVIVMVQPKSVPMVNPFLLLPKE